jgi:hypothetical protein
VVPSHNLTVGYRTMKHVTLEIPATLYTLSHYFQA